MLALLGRNGQDLAARLEDGPRAGGRDVGVGDAIADVLVVRAHLRQVAVDGDVTGVSLPVARS